MDNKCPRLHIAVGGTAAQFFTKFTFVSPDFGGPKLPMTSSLGTSSKRSGRRQHVLPGAPKYAATHSAPKPKPARLFIYAAAAISSSVPTIMPSHICSLPRLGDDSVYRPMLVEAGVTYMMHFMRACTFEDSAKCRCRWYQAGFSTCFPRLHRDPIYCLLSTFRRSRS